MDQSIKTAAKAAEVHPAIAAKVSGVNAEPADKDARPFKYRPSHAAVIEVLGLPADAIGDEVMIALAERLVSVEKQLAALQRATAHITSIQPIKG